MGGISLLAASVVVALLGFGWISAIKDGVFDVWSFITGNNSEEVMEEKLDDSMKDEEDSVKGEEDAMEIEKKGEVIDDLDIEGEIIADPEFDEELNSLEAELDALLNESGAELDALEEEL